MAFDMSAKIFCMDALVKKIIDAARRMAPDAASCRSAISRAGSIAEAYAIADTGVIEEVFGPIKRDSPERTT
jgi:hypothetical protein